MIILVFLIVFRVIQDNSEQYKVCFEKHCFYVELAKTEQERVRGLMFRENLDLNKGMFFIFDEEKKHSFWMKNTLLRLDIIWINENKDVVFIEKDVQPCQENCRSIRPDKKAKYVLELNARIADKINLKIGDKLVFDVEN